MDESVEEWKPIVGYEGYYDVSNYGRVKRIKHGMGAMAGKLLKKHVDVQGYERLSLCQKGRTKTRYAHHLVAAAFIGPRPVGAQINHKDANKSNNRLDNLEYVTNAQNMRHAADLGLFRARIQVRKVTPEDEARWLLSCVI